MLAGHVGAVAALVGERQHRLVRQAGQLTVARPRGDAEVDVALGRVRVTALHQRIDHGQHLRDVIGRARVLVRRQPVQGRHLGQERRHVPVPEGEIVLARLAGLAQHVVVHIGQVLNVANLVAEVLQVPMEDVEAQVGERVAEMAGVVGRDAAHVEADRSGGRRLERSDDAAPGVVEAEGHASDSKARRAG